MLRYKSAPQLLALMLSVAVALIMSACASTSPVVTARPSPRTATHSSTTTSVILRSMRVDIGGYRLYMQCMGQGSPTVIFEAGLGEDVSTWKNVQPHVAQFTQTCAYDRANVAPSDSRPDMLKISAQQIALELHTLLLNAQIPGPYVLVGHSIGGLYMQMYACQYPQDVVGMVLIDSTHPEQAARLGAALGSTFTADVRQSFPAEGISYDDVLALQAQVDAAKNRFPDVPLIVLVRSRFTSAAQWTAAQYQQVWLSLQTDLSKRSPKGKLIVAQNSGHFIQDDRPDLVISSIEEVVMQTRQSHSLPRLPFAD